MTQNDTTETFTQAEEFVITDLETLKVVADPLRLQIVELIFEHAHTVKQIGKKLKLPPSKLYYHINMLEKHGLIAVASTRVVSGIVEKSYQTSARGIRVERGLISPGRPQEAPDDGATILADAILNDTRADIKENTATGLINLSGEKHPRNLRISRSKARFTEEQAMAFQERLHALLEEFKQYKDDPANEEEQGYALVMAFYPTARGARPTEEADDSDQ
jgi:DNA-binding transcriptional ArsR family regulator